MDKLRLAIIGYGRIAQTEHAAALAESPAFDFVAAVTTRTDHGLSIPVFSSVEDLLADPDLGIDAVSICTPPASHHDLAIQCLDAALHVLLEKPVAATLGEAQAIALHSHSVERTALAAWHSRYNAAVDEAVRIITQEGLASLTIHWREDVETWHPGQNWIWQAGGFGVFDAGINALSIATRLVDTPLLVRSAALTMHHDQQQPIEATLVLEAANVTGPMIAEFDWRSKTQDCWSIRAMTQSGTTVELDDGGRRLIVDTYLRATESPGEYPLIYARFAELIATRRSDMDLEPLRLVADALLIAHRDGQSIS